MKILNITKKFEDNVYGGVEKLIDTLCAELRNKKIDSHVYTLREKKIKKRNFKVLYDDQQFSLFSCPVSFKSIWKFIKIRKKYDIYNFHFPWPFMDLLSFFIPRKRIIVTYHADILVKNLLYYLYLPILIIFLARSQKIIVTSPNYVNSSQILKYFKKKISVIPIGIKKKYSLVKVKRKFKKIKKQKYFLFVGNLRYYKGLKYLIKAFKKLNLNLIILGDGKERDLVKNKIKKYPNIKLILKENEQNKFFLIRNCYALILPSIDRREAYGISLVEALSEKKALISTKIKSGTSYVNLHNKTGLEIIPSNSRAIIKSVDFLIKNKLIKKKFEKNAFSRFQKLFTVEKMINNYLKIFNSSHSFVK